GVADRGMEQPGMTGRGRPAALALPGVEPDVVVVAAGGDERRTPAHALHQREAEHSAVEVQRALHVRDTQVHMSDVDPGVDRLGGVSVIWICHGWMYHFREVEYLIWRKAHIRTGLCCQLCSAVQ